MLRFCRLTSHKNNLIIDDFLEQEVLMSSFYMYINIPLIVNYQLSIINCQLLK